MSSSRVLKNQAAKIAIFALLACSVSACTTVRPLPATDAQTVQAQLLVGDEVEILKHDGSEISFTVDKLDDAGVGGGDVHVAYSDIDQLSVRKTSVAKSISLGVGVFFGVIVVGVMSIDEDDIIPSR